LFSNARVPIGPQLLASDVELPGYAVAQFGVGYAFNGVQMDASLTNAFDARYFVRGGPPQLVYAGEPRFFSVSISRKF
jgi:outer membrane receptor for ferric coprogen and ferric-rhodotorulic acid